MGAPLLSLTNAPAQGYALYSYGFVGNGGSMLLSFTHGIQPSFFVLDDVSVTRVPEPATLALLGIGLAGLGFVRRRKRA